MVKVLIVDDSALVRQLLTQILSAHKDIVVVGTASDPFQARSKIKQLNPDVLTLDVEMPRMDGLTFLSNLMRLHPMPVVMVSSLTERGASVTLDAMDLGAIDYVSKPEKGLASSLVEYSEELQSKVISAARVSRAVLEERSKRAILKFEMQRRVESQVEGNFSVDELIAKASNSHFGTTDKVIAIGASTGGTVAIQTILEGLPKDLPGIVISQHIPPQFSASFAKRLDDVCDIAVSEACNGQQIMKGHAYVAPGGKHLLVKKSGAKYVIEISDGIPVNRHKPSVDVMFRSVAQSCGPNSLGIILTGMGADGAVALKEMKESGALTIAQDEKSSVVWGMPGQSVKLGGAEKVVSLDHISQLIIKHF